jgi:hypothetical protein
MTSIVGEGPDRPCAAVCTARNLPTANVLRDSRE